MPTYEYECKRCGLRFERLQSITEKHLVACPEFDGQVNRMLGGRIGLMVGSGKNRFGEHTEHHYSLEKIGKTYCGRNERCNTSYCEDN